MNGDDAGEPILELADFRQTTTRSFIERVRRRVQRRQFGSNFASFYWNAPLAILLEFLKLIFGLFASPGPPKGDSR